MQLNLERQFSITSSVGDTSNKRVRSNTYHILLTYISNTITLNFYVLGITCFTVPENGCSSY